MNHNVITKLKRIEIQTISWCNSKCVVCPWVQIKDSIPRQSVSEEIWYKILEGVSALSPDVIIPYMNNEPLLDKNIASRILDLRRLRPQASIEFSTNGILLTEASSVFLVNHVDLILISLFGSDETGNLKLMGKGMSYNRVKNNILKLRKAKEESGSRCIINIVKIINHPFMSNDSILKDWIFWEDEGIDVRYYDFVDRATNVGDFSQRNKTHKTYGCDYNRHNESTSIYYNGETSFCCHDWRREYVMGNLRENSLWKIINGEKYHRIRQMVDGTADSDDNFLCKKCFNCKTGPRNMRNATLRDSVNVLYRQ